MTALRPQKLSSLFQRAHPRRLVLVSMTALSSLFMAACHNNGRTKDNSVEKAAIPKDTMSLCLYGCPEGAPAGNRVISRPVYILSNNGDTKFADWVAYEVTFKTIGPTEKRVWSKDDDLPPEETLEPADYKDASKILHTDRGHQAPLASLTGTPYWQMANELSNITPQSKDLNEGPWERLEQAERNLALSDTTLVVYSVTGPLYERDMPRLPHADEPHKVPSGYWKIVAIDKNGVIETAAYIMEQSLPRDADFSDQRTTIRIVEQRSHLDFFPKLPRAQQDRLENKHGTLEQKLSTAKQPGTFKKKTAIKRGH